MTSSQTNKIGDILLIDDTPDNLRFLSDLLHRAGYTVRKVINGELGIEAAQLEPPDLILLDIKMPGLDGYKVCDQLKNSERTDQIPIIFLSAMNEELDKVMAFEAGGIDYITKPFQVVEVLARIENHLQVSRLRQALQQQNAQLQQEIQQRSSAETALEILNQGLEARIRERTAELQLRNEQLLNLQTQLQQTLTQERRLNELKSQVITTIADQLRTTLTVIGTSAELLKCNEGGRLKADNQYLNLIGDSVTSMNQVLQNALILTETQTEIPSSTLKPIDLTQFCQAFVEQWKLPETPSYQLSLISWGKPPAAVQADEILLQQILSQLLSNAVRYSPSGGTILFQLIYEPSQVLIQIRDEGIGIPAAEIERVFERFYRASNADQIAEKTGAGLGLAVVKQAVERQGGTVEISSELNKGTLISVRLPLLRQEGLEDFME